MKYLPENNPYIVQGNLENLPGDTLTVRPGVMVEFEPGSSIHVYGHFVADGTSEERITFQGRQEQDNTWSGIHFYQSSPQLNVDDNNEYVSGPSFTYCDFEKGYLNDNGFTGVYISHCYFTESSTTNRIAWGSILTSEFVNGGTGINVSPLEDNWLSVHSLDVKNSQFASNSGYGIDIDWIDHVEISNSIRSSKRSKNDQT